MTKTMIKIGIADAHGIESFCDKTERQLGIFALRASLNRQRHAVAYSVIIDEKTNKEIQGLLKKASS